MKKTQKYESSIAANVLLVLWEGITPEELLRLVIKRELYCGRELSISPLDNTPKSVKDLLNETDPYIFSGNNIEGYEKLHPEVLVKPEPKTQKEVIPPYLALSGRQQSEFCAGTRIGYQVMGEDCKRRI